MENTANTPNTPNTTNATNATNNQLTKPKQVCAALLYSQLELVAAAAVRCDAVEVEVEVEVEVAACFPSSFLFCCLFGFKTTWQQKR